MDRSVRDAISGQNCLLQPSEKGSFDQKINKSDVPGVVEGFSEIYAQWECEDLIEWEINDAECLSLTRQLWAKGFPVGPSSGLNLAAAIRVGQRVGKDKRIVTVFPDRMERYFSHKVFEGIR